MTLKKFFFDGIRGTQVDHGRWSLAFAIYPWPWVQRFDTYRTLAGQIIDCTGLIKWLCYAKRYNAPLGRRAVQVRIMCVCMALSWEVAP